MRTIIFLFGVAIGVSLLVFREQFAKKCMKDQNRTWGLRFGEREIRVTEVVTVIVGLGFIICGVLCLLGIGKVR